MIKNFSFLVMIIEATTAIISLKSILVMMILSCQLNFDHKILIGD